ncbi:MAG: peptide chain release factor N(5)-glutamine methyltransferase [Victivallales bacterium]|nr:peptide chain release factor N(5)-glutamine methyltransferase [Victivallales bacterium]
MKTYIQTVKNTAVRLEKAGIESARTESELIICELAACSRAELFMCGKETFPAALAGRLETITARREKREPLQYILGHAYFMDLELEVNPAVLIPRPETELMVERICREAPPEAALLDIGTGSGAVALAAAFARPDLRVTAVDISPEALETATRNRDRYRLDNVELLQSDLFSGLQNRSFDYIAANLPYVTEREYPQLMPEVRDFEPRQALVAAQEGMDVIFRCIREAPVHMRVAGKIIFEMGSGQAQKLAATLAANGSFDNIAVIQDYSRRDRFVSARLIPMSDQS